MHDSHFVRRMAAALVPLAVVTTAAAQPPSEAVPAPSKAVPTFARDVAPIVFDHCASCHRSGDIAPMSFLSYREVRPWARAIRDKVVAREMPPWHAAPGGVPIRNVRSLSQAQIDTVAAWADAGAPLGDPADLPPPPVFTANEWHHPSGRPPDIILESPVVMEIPADGELPYYNLVPVKAANKGAQAPAESPEGRASTKGNSRDQSTHRTQGRDGVSQAVERIRQAATRAVCRQPPKVGAVCVNAHVRI